jgi:hypothetical protein
MNFDKSPWEATFIENFQDDKSVILIKAHHALCDGLSAVSLIVSLADSTEESSFVDLHKKSMFSDLSFFCLSMLYLPIALAKQFTRRPDKSFIHTPTSDRQTLFLVFWAHPTGDYKGVQQTQEYQVQHHDVVMCRSWSAEPLQEPQGAS